MKIFNIDEALKLPQTFNVLHNAMDELYAKRQEEFQTSNPLKEIYQTVYLNQFQKSFGSSTGYKQAFEQTVDYAAYPGFSSGDGFKTTISYKPFNGKVVFTWQTLLESDYSRIKEDLKNYQIAWQRQLVEFGMFALTAFFGGKVYDKVSKTWTKIMSADTPDGDVLNDSKNPVFTKNHTIVRREGMTDNEFNSMKQSNKFYVNVALDGSDPLAHMKIANALEQIEVYMSKLLDDNGKRAGVNGRKKIIGTKDAHMNAVIKSILATDNFSYGSGKPSLNPVKDGFDTYFTPYLEGNFDQEIPQFRTDPTDKHARGLLILDPSYNSANHGPMMVERVPFSIKAVKTDEPEGIKYLAKQAFDFFCPAWRGIAYVYIGLPAGGAGTWNDVSTFTEIVPAIYGPAVTVINGTNNPVHVLDGDYEQILYGINVTAGANGAAVITGGTDTEGSSVAGADISITATPSAGYVIDAITIAGVPYNETAGVITFIMPSKNVTVSVTFKVEPVEPAA